MLLKKKKCHESSCFYFKIVGIKCRHKIWKRVNTWNILSFSRENSSESNEQGIVDELEWNTNILIRVTSGECEMCDRILALLGRGGRWPETQIENVLFITYATQLQIHNSNLLFLSNNITHCQQQPFAFWQIDSCSKIIYTSFRLYFFSPSAILDCALFRFPATEVL